MTTPSVVTGAWFSMLATVRPPWIERMVKTKPWHLGLISVLHCVERSGASSPWQWIFSEVPPSLVRARSVPQQPVRNWNSSFHFLAPFLQFFAFFNQQKIPVKRRLVFTWAAKVLLAWTAGAFTNLEAILQPLKIFTSQHWTGQMSSCYKPNRYWLMNNCEIKVTSSRVQSIK